MLIYKATNILNGKVYIGQTNRSILDKRKKEHFYSKDGTYFHNAVKKYGWNNFLWETIAVCSDTKKLDELEKHYIAYYKANNSLYGYNETLGGEHGALGYTHSSEARLKMSIKKIGVVPHNKGKAWSLEIRKKISESNKGKPKFLLRGRKFSEEHKKHLSESRIGKTPWNKGKTNIFSESTLQRMSDVKKGRSTWNKGRSWSEEFKKILSESNPHKKQVIRSDGVVFSSIANAAKELGVNRINVSRALRKKSKTVNGYTFTLG